MKDNENEFLQNYEQAFQDMQKSYEILYVKRNALVSDSTNNIMKALDQWRADKKIGEKSASEVEVNKKGMFESVKSIFSRKKKQGKETQQQIKSSTTDQEVLNMMKRFKSGGPTVNDVFLIKELFSKGELKLDDRAENGIEYFLNASESYLGIAHEYYSNMLNEKDIAKREKMLNFNLKKISEIEDSGVVGRIEGIDAVDIILSRIADKLLESDMKELNRLMNTLDEIERKVSETPWLKTILDDERLEYLVDKLEDNDMDIQDLLNVTTIANDSFVKHDIRVDDKTYADVIDVIQQHSLLNDWVKEAKTQLNNLRIENFVKNDYNESILDRVKEAKSFINISKEVIEGEKSIAQVIGELSKIVSDLSKANFPTRDKKDKRKHISRKSSLEKRSSRKLTAEETAVSARDSGIFKRKPEKRGPPKREPPIYDPKKQVGSGGGPKK